MRSKRNSEPIAEKYPRLVAEVEECLAEQGTAGECRSTDASRTER